MNAIREASESTFRNERRSLSIVINQFHSERYILIQNQLCTESVLGLKLIFLLVGNGYKNVFRTMFQ